MVANNITYCPNSLVIYQLTRLMGISVSRTWIQNQLRTSLNYPFSSLRDVGDALRAANLDVSEVKVSPKLFVRLDPPFIAYVKEQDEQNFFVLVKDIQSSQITYYAADRGESSESVDSFFRIWSGFVILTGNAEHKASVLKSDDPEEHFRECYRSDSIRIIPEFLSPEHCKMIVDYTESAGNYFRSEIIEEAGDTKVDANRSSLSAELPEKVSPLFKELKSRVAAVLNTSVSNIEQLQCVKYSPGQFFGPHFDSNSTLNRKHTILIYLNENFIGGETYFPELLLTVQPKTGTALWFLNQDDDRNIIPYSRHAGLPVRYGTKYACNVWVKDNAD